MFLLWIALRVMFNKAEPFERRMVEDGLGLWSPEMRPHWRRLFNVWRNPSDISHALVNIPVEWGRLDPQRAVKFGILDQFVFWLVLTLVL